VQQYPQVDVQRHLSVDPPSLSDEAYGVITRGRTGKTEIIKTRGNLTINDGSIAVQWALDGHGILMRAEWDIREHLTQGQLVQLLPQHHTPDADIYAVYPAQHKSAARVRAFVDFVAEAFRPARP